MNNARGIEMISYCRFCCAMVHKKEDGKCPKCNRRSYQWYGKDMRAICLYCGKDYKEHKEELECEGLK